MFNAISAELFRLRHANAYRYMTLGYLLFCLCYNLYWAVQFGGTYADMGASAFDMVVASLNLSGPFTSIAAGLFYCLYIGGDFTNGSTGMRIASGQRRGTVLLVKALAVSLGAVPYFLLYPATACLWTALLYGWAGPTLAVGPLYLLRCLLLNTAVSLGLLTVVILIITLLRDGLKAAAAAFALLFLTSGPVGELFALAGDGDALRLMENSLESNSPLFAIGQDNWMLSPYLTGGRIGLAVLATVVLAAAVLGISCRVFSRTDL